MLVKDGDENSPGSENGAKPKTGPSGPESGETLTPHNDERESDQSLLWRRGRVEAYPKHGIEILLAA